MHPHHSLAIVTGASSGIGYELAVCCARAGYDLLIAADEPEIHLAADKLKPFGVNVESMEVNLSTFESVDRFLASARGRPIGAVLANAGRGLGDAFVDQNADAWKHVVDTNITGTIYLVQKVAKTMCAAKDGRILITGSVADFVPGTTQAVYNGTKAFLDSFATTLRHEVQDSGVTVTCLMPGATETKFFERANMNIGQLEKQDAESVARIGFEAMMRGESEVISGWQNKLSAGMASDIAAEMHARMAAPGGGAHSFLTM